MPWSVGLSLRGIPGAQIRYGHGAPSTTNPAVQNDGDGYLDVDSGQFYAVRSGGVWPSTYATFVGPPGLSLLYGNGAPDPSLGVVGQPGYLDLANGVLYGAKTSSGWPSTGLTLSTEAASVPADVMANSLVLSPVQGDAALVQLQMLNSAGNMVFSVDATGDVAIGGALNVTGVATLPTLNAGLVTAQTVSVLGELDAKGDFKVTGATTLKVTTADSLTVNALLQAATLKASDVQTGSLEATGAVSCAGLTSTGLATANALQAETLTVGQSSDTGVHTTLYGDIKALGAAQLGAVTSVSEATGQLAVSGPSTLTGAVTAGPLTAAQLVAQMPQGSTQPPFEVLDATGNQLLACDTQGDVLIKGTLMVAGAQTNDATNAGALTATSFIDSGNATIQGTLKAQGATTLSDTTVQDFEAQSVLVDGTLTVHGMSNLAQIQATLVDFGNLQVDGPATLNQGLAVTGATTLGALQAGSIAGNSGTFTSGVGIGGGLQVTGISSLGGVTAGSMVGTSLHITGTSALDGAVTTGALSAPSLAITLPSSGGASTPLSVKKNDGTALLSLDNTGALVIAGALTVNGGNAGGAENFGALTVSSFLDTGNGEFQGNLKVDGSTSAQAITATDVATGTLEASGNATVGGTAAITGALSSASLNTGAVSASSLTTRGVTINTDQFGNGGTLSVSVQANLPTTYTSDLHSSSAQVSGGVSAGSLSVSGSASLASLNVSGATSLAGTSAGALTATSVASAGNVTAASALKGGTVVVQGSSSQPVQVLDASGNALMTLDGQGDLSIKGTLSVTGQPTGQANNLGAVTVTSLVDSGNATVQGTLGVTGLTSLGQLQTSGNTSLATTSTGALTASSLNVTNNATVGGTLSITGATTLAGITTGALSASSVSVTGNETVGGTLGVTGTSTLGVVSTGALTASSAAVTGNETVGGTLRVTGATSLASTLAVTGNSTLAGTAVISGATTVPSLTINLPSSGASSTPFQLSANNGNALVTVDASGNATFAGSVTSSGTSSSSGPTTVGALTASSITDTGTLSVTGQSTLGAVTVSSLTNTGTGTVGALVVQLPSSNAAAKPINLLSSGNSSLFSVDSSGNGLFAGTLGVTGATSLSTLATSGAATLNSASVTNGLSAATLSTSGAATLNSLAVTNGATASTLSVTNGASAGRFVATGPGTSSAPLLAYTSTTGNPTGVYSDSNFGSYYELTNGYLTRQSRYLSGSPADQGAGFLSHLYYTSITGGGNTAYRWYVGTSTVAMQMAGNGALSLASTLGVAALTTTAGLTLSSGALTFADGTSLTTATVPNQTAYTVTSAGTAAAPAFRFSGGTSPAGVYFDSAPGNVLLSVNGYKSLYSTAASGAAQGANGWAIASTLGSGSNLLALYGGGSTTTPVAAIDGVGTLTSGAHTASGTVTGTNLTISASGGKLTFGDGTTMTTAATGSGGGASSTARTYIPLGTTYRSTATTGSVRSYDTMNQIGTTTAVRVENNVQMPGNGSIVGLHIYNGYTSGTQQAVTVQVYKNVPTATTGSFISVAGTSATQTYPPTPITFAVGTYTFAAGDILGMGTTSSGSNAFTSSVGLYVIYTS